MEKVGYFVKDEQDHADTQGANGQDTNNGETSLRSIEDSQHSGDRTHEPGRNGGQNRQNGLDNAGTSTGQHQGIKQHKKTQPFKNFIMHGLATTGALDKKGGKN